MTAKQEALAWIALEMPTGVQRVKAWSDGSGESLQQVEVDAKNGMNVHRYVISPVSGAVWRQTWDGQGRGTQLRP